jgi:hypothetical protein
MADRARLDGGEEPGDEESLEPPRFGIVVQWKVGNGGEMLIPRFLCGLVLAAAFAAACGGKHEYPDEAVNSFMTSCTSQAGATESSCRCVLDNLEESMSFEEFKRVDTAIRAGGTASIPDDSREKFLDAISDCRSTSTSSTGLLRRDVA